jgi:stearoyl-CoA desaturase (delta-9 desaturase)
MSTTEQATIDPVKIADVRDFSYSEQYDDLFSKPLIVNRPVPKPSESAQIVQPNAKKILFSKVYGVLKRNRFLKRSYGPQDITYGIFFAVLHALCLFAPKTFSWRMLGLAFVTYFTTGCMGITFSFHRQLSHRAFQTPKWLEYFMAYCASMAIQGDPVTWVSDHRYHHLHTDTPLDLHSPYEGFWWSHMGWMFDEEAHDMRAPTMSNASDLLKQPFYQHMKKFYFFHIMLKLIFMYAIAGFPGLVWGGAVATVFLWHVTFFVNSASHVWGNQPFRTGDLSRNIWWVGILAFGEGWHNNHHAFEFSARHGMLKNQFDITWLLIRGLQAVGLATNVKLPSQAQINRLTPENSKIELAFKPA